MCLEFTKRNGQKMKLIGFCMLCSRSDITIDTSANSVLRAKKLRREPYGVCATCINPNGVQARATRRRRRTTRQGALQ